MYDFTQIGRSAIVGAIAVVATTAIDVGGADAATTIDTGGTSLISAGEVLSFTSMAESTDKISADPLVYGWEHTFEAELSGLGATRLSLTLLNFSGFTESILVQWLDASDTSNVVASTTLSEANCTLDDPIWSLPQDGDCGTFLVTSFPPLDQILRLTWDPKDATGNLTISGSISVIPVPAAGWLTLSLLAGWLTLGRRRKAVAA